MEILSMAMDISIAFVVLGIALACSWGSILFVLDEQTEWEAKRDYEEMNKSIKEGEKNDTSRDK